MVSIEEALRIILEHTAPLHDEEVPLLQAVGRIIAEEIRAPWDLPPADCSAMDGFAFRHAAVPSGGSMRVAGFVPAGGVLSVPVAPGEAVRIMTGAPLPAGCDTVVPFEEVKEEAGRVLLVRSIKAGSHVRLHGENVRADDLVIAFGTILHPAEIGVIASLGRARVRVYRRPEVAVLATGDELVEAGTVPGSAMIVNSNSYSLAAQVMEAGGNPVMLGIARDDLAATQAKLCRGLAADCIMTSGGVSVGDRDFVKEAIAALGGEVKFWKIDIKPGKPVAFAVVQGKPVFALPGNPVSAMVAFEQFVRPAILKMSGRRGILRPVVRGIMTAALKNTGDRPHVINCRVSCHDGRYLVASTGEQHSANLITMLAASGHVRLAPGESVQPGDEVEVMLFDREFEMREPCHVADR